MDKHQSDSCQDPRLHKDRNVWIATTRPDGRPHLVPVWFVLSDSRWYICVEPGSVKESNLQSNPCLTLALEDGSEPYIVEGIAHPVSMGEEVVDLFKTKYAWDIRAEKRYTILLEITVHRRLMDKA